VPLDELTTPGELGGRLARELDVPLKGRTEPLEQVVDALRTRRRLLVLDNFEQIVDAAPMLERLLAACPHVKAVVTSRVRLNLASEWLLPLEGLPYPEDEDREQLESFDAARLFVRSARRVRPDLMPAAEASAIIDICRQVEGLPLALELAAAWTRVLSCAAIAHELRHGMELLQAADSTRPARHASIDVVFEQSWRLLTDIERDVLARLSVFHGSFMPEAARKVARAPLPVLGALADKSLLQRDGARIRLHPLVQQLASVRLGERQAREAHGEYVRFFSQLMHRWQRPVENGDREALSLIEADFENCRAAWNRAVDLGDTAALKRSVSTLTNFCDHRSRPSAGLALLRLASDSVASGSDSAWLALLLGKAAHLEYRLDRYSEAMALAADGLATLGPIPDADARGQCLLVLGTCELRLGKYRRALEYLEESLALSPECSDVRHRAGMLTAMALAHKGLGDYDETLRLTLEALQEQRRTGDVASEAMSLNNLAAFYLERLQFDVAAGYLTTALVICERHGLTGSLGAVLINLMIADAKSGRYDAAAIHGARALEHARAIGNRFYLSFIRLQFVAIALARCDLDSARGELRQGMELALEIGRPVLFIQGLSAFGEILQAQGEAACAHAVTRFAIDHPSTAPLDRDEMIQKLDKWPALTGPVPPWPDWSLEELAHRIMVETSVAYAPLIAALRGLH
jgi:predicted ATPase/Tfp pilus assembly protein PilF